MCHAKPAMRRRLTYLRPKYASINEKPRRVAGLELAGVCLGLPDYERESSDNPRLNAFCRVAPSVRFRVRAILTARVFLRASVFSVRTSDVVHERRFELLAIFHNLHVVENKLFGEASLDGKGEKLSHEIVVNSSNSSRQSV